MGLTPYEAYKIELERFQVRVRTWDLLGGILVSIMVYGVELFLLATYWPAFSEFMWTHFIEELLVTPLLLGLGFLVSVLIWFNLVSSAIHNRVRKKIAQKYNVEL